MSGFYLEFYKSYRGAKGLFQSRMRILCGKYLLLDEGWSEDEVLLMSFFCGISSTVVMIVADRDDGAGIFLLIFHVPNMV